LKKKIFLRLRNDLCHFKEKICLHLIKDLCKFDKKICVRVRETLSLSLVSWGWWAVQE